MPFFLQGLPFLYTFPFCKYTLHVCYVFNVNLTDSFDDRLNLLPAVRIEPSTARSKLKSNALTDCAMGAIQ